MRQHGNLPPWDFNQSLSSVITFHIHGALKSEKSAIWANRPKLQNLEKNVRNSFLRLYFMIAGMASTIISNNVLK